MRMASGHGVWLELRRYPATLVLYALGLGAVAADRLRFLGRVLAVGLDDANREQVPAVSVLPPACLFEDGEETMRLLEGMDKRRTPMCHWIHRTLRPYVERIIPDDGRYSFAFDKLEVLTALNYGRHGSRGWPPLGAFVSRRETWTTSCEKSGNRFLQWGMARLS